MEISKEKMQIWSIFVITFPPPPHLSSPSYTSLWWCCSLLAGMSELKSASRGGQWDSSENVCLPAKKNRSMWQGPSPFSCLELVCDVWKGSSHLVTMRWQVWGWTQHTKEERVERESTQTLALCWQSSFISWASCYLHWIHTCPTQTGNVISVPQTRKMGCPAWQNAKEMS